MWQMYDITLSPNLKLKEKNRENTNKNENKIKSIIYNSDNVSLSFSGLNLLSSLSTLPKYATNATCRSIIRAIE